MSIKLDQFQRKDNTSLRKSSKRFLKQIWNPLRHTPIHRTIFPRRFHALCLGVPKSGTHSVANLFNTNYRAAHEPDASTFIEHFFNQHESHKTQRHLIQRDEYYWLEMEASHYLILQIEEIVEAFPNIKVILTVRDCYSWIQSMMNQIIRTPINADTEHWQRLRHFYFRKPKSEFLAEEENIKLIEGFYPLENFFYFWNDYYQRVISVVPQENLLILKTKELGKNVHLISDFLDIKKDSLLAINAHSGRAPEYHINIFSEVDYAFIESSAKKHCEKMMNQFFLSCSIADYL